jgi:hypothetical protein
LESVLTKRFPLLFTVHVLRNRLTHQPVRCALARRYPLRVGTS